MSAFSDMPLGLMHRFTLSNMRGDELAHVLDVGNVGSKLKTISIERSGGFFTDEVIGIKTNKIKLVDAAIVNTSWQVQMIDVALNGHTDDNGEDYKLEDLETGRVWYILDAIPIEYSISWSRNRDGIVVMNVTLSARRIFMDNVRGSGTLSNFDDMVGTIAFIGDYPLMIAGKETRTVSSKYTDGSIPGVDGKTPEWVSGSGETITLPFILMNDKSGNADEKIKDVIALAKKDPDSGSPKVFSFQYGNITITHIIVKSVKITTVMRDAFDSVRVARGVITIQEYYVDTEHTSAQEKQLGVYRVIRNGETYQSIAYELWEDESLWVALGSWQPRPFSAGPIIDQGTIISIPPWEFVQRFQDADDGEFPWL